ncbi:hypothetical protein [Oricola sp.]|uniref:hypothetical protein n=1 Tax=Oricola sp. TaxID=1979950 RepID=UPI000C92748D|nr:hypothetical protein [Ahrensia sp.]|tara:strand:+ start:7930 stop:8340 length:411 start_codon:yes stop_codon:yes gene_type:complete
MNTTLTHRNIFAALVLVPAMALGGLVAEPIAGKSGAEAQQQSFQRSPDYSRPDRKDSSDEPRRGRTPPPCIPGTASVAAIDCTPWTPPRFTASSKEDCECHIVYKTVNGQRVAEKDCYVLLPTNKVYYCQNPRAVN